jgi:hypothetical protein
VLENSGIIARTKSQCTSFIDCYSVRCDLESFDQFGTVVFIDSSGDVMASVTCQRCNTQYAVIGCDECKTLVCGNCSSMCAGCGVSICVEHTHLTKGGRKLCGRCTAERQERQQALKSKYGKGQRIAPSISVPDSGESAASSAVPPPSAPPAPGKPVGAATDAAFKGVAFADIAGSSPLIPIRETEREIEEEAGVGPEHEDPEMRLDPEEAEKSRKARETAHLTSTGRLELPPMDQNRPVLGQSGYQPPSRIKVMAAFILFGIGSMLFYNSTPYLKETLFLFDTRKPQFYEGQMAQIQDTNKIRNTSNIQQFDIFSQAPMFFVSWFILLVFGVIRSSYWSYIAKRNLEAARNLDKDANQLL